MDAQEMEAFAGVKITPDKSVKGEDPITTSLPKTPGRPMKQFTPVWNPVSEKVRCLVMSAFVRLVERHSLRRLRDQDWLANDN